MCSSRPNSFDLFLQMQFLPFQVRHYDIIGRRMRHGFRDFMLECSVFFNELLKMRFYRQMYFSLW
jgi:hypothetical protein